jgi:sigma-B regulation protein RsbU (phosphoserine phosphatase)
VVLSDINMPEMDGLTLLTKMSEIDFPIKAVIVSAYGDIKNIRTAMNRGAFDFVIKPIDFADLEITIKKTLHEIATLKQALQARDQLVAIHKELSIANNIQQSILPRKFPPFPERTEFDLFAEMIPAKEVGGDFYDFFLIDDGRLGFVIGDVSGKGMPAAIFMAVSRTLIRAIAMKKSSPADCLQQVNDILARENVRSMFVTIFYGVLDWRTGELEYCNGGHNPPFYIARDGRVAFLEKIGGLALGLVEGSTYQARKMVLQPGEALFLYTDGITEAMDGANNEFSEARLQDFLQQAQAASAAEMIRGAVDAVRAFAGEAPQADDITALAIKYQPR